MVIAPGSIDMDVYRGLQISESGKVDLLTTSENIEALGGQRVAQRSRAGLSTSVVKRSG